MRVLSWNVNQSANSSGRIDRQLEVIEDHDADVVLLQGVRYEGARRWLDNWIEGLENSGLGELEHSCDWAAELSSASFPPHSDIDHNNGHITAVSNDWSLERIEPTVREYAKGHDWTHYTTHFPERILVTQFETPTPEVEVWNVRTVPGGEYGEETIKILETVYNRLMAAGQRTRILAGDLNAPKAELADGQMISYGYEKEETIRDRWVTAERNVLRGLGQLEMVDAFRTRNGYGDLAVADTSWNGKRFDHVFASSDLPIVECWYDQSAESSDHEPIIAEIGI